MFRPLMIRAMLMNPSGSLDTGWPTDRGHATALLQFRDLIAVNSLLRARRLSPYGLLLRAEMGDPIITLPTASRWIISLLEASE